ncbi:MAG: glucokinase [Deltaproteobacteria bacterium]|nr:glucokinase [Deltaproteobacteria bacterium]
MKRDEKRRSEQFLLAGDLGGTKTSLALFSLDSKRPIPHLIETLSSKNASSFQEIIEVFLSRHPAKVMAACFGVAGPVSKGHVKITNLPWAVSEDELKELFNWERVHLINDLAATALSVPVLQNHELAELNYGRPDPSGVIGVVAPGTGLGMALMLFINGKAYPIQSEGGHVDFAPKNSVEIAMLQDLIDSHVSVERLASGPGLFTIYSWLKDYRNYREPGWLHERLLTRDVSQVISEAAFIEKDPLCIESLDMFTSILGATAGNLALTGMTTGGIYLAGGICPKILPKLKERHFMRAFTAKGRFMEFLSKIPVKVILNDKAALLGAACCAMRLMEK